MVNNYQQLTTMRKGKGGQQLSTINNNCLRVRGGQQLPTINNNYFWGQPLSTITNNFFRSLSRDCCDSQSEHREQPN